MKEPDLKKIRKAMEKELDPKRYEHTLGVAYTAASLAMRYGADLNSALIAGMLHDCAKCLSNEKKISICKKHDIPINPAEEKNPFLLHAKVGSYLASKKYGVTDPDILNAIFEPYDRTAGYVPAGKNRMAIGLYRARQKAGSKSSGNPKDRF